MKLHLRDISIFVVMISLSGCALQRRNPLLVADQAKLIRDQDKRLKPYAVPVQEKIKAAGTLAALVIVPRNDLEPLVIAPTDDPLTTAQAHLDSLEKAVECIVAFRRDLAIEPEPLSCPVLAIRAKEGAAVRVVLPLHEVELRSLEDRFSLLEKAYKSSSDMVGKNNEQIDSMIKDLNSSLEQIRQQLEQFKNKLDSIK